MSDSLRWVERCDRCSEPEAIELLDGGGEEFGLGEDELRCIHCHPCWDAEAADMALSVNPKFSRAYRLYLSGKRSRWARLELSIRRMIYRARISMRPQVGRGGNQHA